MLVAVAVHGIGALAAEPGLERSRAVVDALVDHPGVVPGLVPPHRPLTLQHLDARARVAAAQLAGDGQPDDPRSDHGEVALHERLGPGHRSGSLLL